MNVVDCYVIKVNEPPYERNGNWFLKVDFNTYGIVSTTTLIFKSEKEAENVGIGYKFLS